MGRKLQTNRDNEGLTKKEREFQALKKFITDTYDALINPNTTIPIHNDNSNKPIQDE